VERLSWSAWVSMSTLMMPEGWTQKDWALSGLVRWVWALMRVGSLCKSRALMWRIGSFCGGLNPCVDQGSDPCVKGRALLWRVGPSCGGSGPCVEGRVSV
jgi:hypothetical protein